MTTNQKNVLLNLRPRPVRFAKMSDDEALEVLEQLRVTYATKREGRALAKAIESIKNHKQYEVLHNIGVD